MILIDICHSINPTRALALFGQSVKGNIEWGWEVPKLSTLFAKLVTKKSSLNEYGIRSSWLGHDQQPGQDKSMWIHHFFVMQFVHPYFRPPRDWDGKAPHAQRIERSFSCTRKERSTSGWSTIKILLITNLLPVSEECRNTQFFGKGNVGLLLSLIVILADLTMMTKYTCFGMAKRWFTCLVYCLVSCYL